MFIDELDAIGRRRGTVTRFGHDEREQTLNQILVGLEGFERTDAIVVIAATNRSDILDPALLRPGRFDRRIKVPPLSVAARQQTLKIHTRNKTLSDDISLSQLAERTAGFSGEELESVANEAALLAVRRARQSTETKAVISQVDFVRAIGPIRSDRSELDQLETLLIDSVNQLARPTGDAIARISVRGGSDFVGQVVWADASFIKLKGLVDDEETIIAKQLIESLEALPDTERASEVELAAPSLALEVPSAV